MHPKITPLRRHALAIAAGLALMVAGGTALADPPARVARLGYLSGAVSFSPAGEDGWDQAAINRPLSPGDRLWADTDGRAEVQVGGAMIRLNAATAVSLLNLDDQIAQLQLTEGSLNVRVRRLEPDQSVEVDTPHLAFTLREPGEYRIDVDADGNATTIRMRQGQGEVTGEGGSYLMQAPQTQRFTSDAARDEAYSAAPPPDDFDRWASERDRASERSVSARYVSPDVVGYEDLDNNGSWRVDATYGNVWYPRRVASNWAPYRDGHWAWIDPWGWTWVDDAPWGFAVSHYGRWAHVRGTWGWIPGPVKTRAYYAPALVVFVGGDNFKLKISAGGIGGVAWFPLGPREVYRPAYKVSPGYFERVNVSNTVVNKTVVNNVYINKTVVNNNITYVNRRVPGAVVAVPSATFTKSEPVAKAVIKPSRAVIESREVASAAPVAPTEKSVRGAAAQGGKPPARAFERPVVARTAPPAAHASFAAQKARLEAQPGKPLDDDERKTLKAAAPAAATKAVPAVKVVAAKTTPPQTLPPRKAAANEDREPAQGQAQAPAAKASAPRANRPPTANTQGRQAASAPSPRQAGKAATVPPVANDGQADNKADKSAQDRKAAAIAEQRQATPSAAERKAARAARREAPASEPGAAPSRQARPRPEPAAPQTRAQPAEPAAPQTRAQRAEPVAMAPAAREPRPAASQAERRERKEARQREQQRRDETPPQ